MEDLPVEQLVAELRVEAIVGEPHHTD
jgi:hypothetical protein